MYAPLKVLLSLGGLTPKELAARVWREMNKDDIFNRAAILGFYFMLALIPLLLCLTALLGLFAQSATELRDSLFSLLARVAPRSAYALVYDTVNEVTEGGSGGKLTFGLLASVWAASNGMLAIIDTLNTAYHVREARPWWKARLVAAALTLALGVLIISALVLVLYGGQVSEALSGALGLGGAFAAAWGVIQWVLVLTFVFLAFGLIYYFAPNLHEQRFRWVLPGMVVGVMLWLAGSLGFRLYLRYFNTYNAVYGSLGAVIILMLWFYLTGAAILVGGEVNSEIEKAAAKDGEEDAKLPGEKSPGEKAGVGGEGGGAQRA
ncbi:MAG TPA: YihY/virulence factor BrkB family protein [Pyrinomonadaceae bacterium]|nr:YihY/virulence factor BrkB family protein [Pyrinomonadaceae bacterium]